MAATQNLHATNFGPQTINLPPNNTTTTIALPITQTINNPIFSDQEHQTPAYQETQQFPANSLPTPSHQELAELHKAHLLGAGAGFNPSLYIKPAPPSNLIAKR